MNLDLVIFVKDFEMFSIFLAFKRKAKLQLDDSNNFQNKIVTEIEPAPTFYQAEDYDQKYYQKIGEGNCYHLN